MSKNKSDSILYGMLAGVGILAFYISVLSFFQGFDFAIMSFRSLWYWLIPLSVGFGLQVGLFINIKHTAQVNGTVAVSGGVAGGSMVACCSHFLLNIIPIVGASGIAVFLMAYQEWFFGLGIGANLFGIGLMVRHKKNMQVKNCCKRV